MVLISWKPEPQMVTAVKIILINCQDENPEEKMEENVDEEETKIKCENFVF